MSRRRTVSCRWPFVARKVPAVDPTRGPRGPWRDRRPPRQGRSARRRPTARARPRPSPPRRPRRAARSPRSRRSRARARRREAGRRSRAPDPDATMSRPEPYRTWASASAVTPETWIRRGASPRLRAQAPPPRCAHQRSSSAGADMTAAWSSPSRSTARSVPNSGTPADVVVGAVDRVDVPAHRCIARLGAVLLADEAVVREGVGQALADHALRSAVSAWVTNVRSGLVVISRSRRKCARRDDVGLVAGRLGDLEPAAKLGVGAAPERGGPVGAEGPAGSRSGHERILALSGSYSGSRATSKPIHSPKTSISPRVPIAARSGGR